jgi:hypothetical protein
MYSKTWNESEERPLIYLQTIEHVYLTLKLHECFQRSDQQSTRSPLGLFGLRDNSFIFPTRYIIQCTLEMLLRSFQARALLVRL